MGNINVFFFLALGVISTENYFIYRAQDKGISPPLKLKIKFGKDKTGAITHGKIKTKHSPSSGEEKEETTKTSSKRLFQCRYSFYFL